NPQQVELTLDSPIYHLIVERAVGAEGKMSTSWVQRKIGISYRLAAEAMTRMEEDGDSSAALAAGQRRVYRRLEEGTGTRNEQVLARAIEYVEEMRGKFDSHVAIGREFALNVFLVIILLFTLFISFSYITL